MADVILRTQTESLSARSVKDVLIALLTCLHWSLTDELPDVMDS